MEVMRILALVLACGMAVAEVRTVRVPAGGVQPQVVVSGDLAHMVYLVGEPGRADVMYVRSSDEGRTFSAPVRVNSQAGSAVATGTIRGAHLAVGKAGRVHVAWNGPTMQYARWNGKAFEPQRNLMQKTSGLDGGGSLAADAAGHVYVVWHGRAEGGEGGDGAAGVGGAVGR